MVFSSIIFLFGFFPLFLLCYFIPKKRKTRNIVLLLFSLLFYGYGEPIYVFLMLASILVNYYLALMIDSSSKSKLYLGISVLFNLGLLFYFKYFDFFLSNINNWFGFNVKFLEVSLPIGISFYTFQILTYVIDVYKNKVPVQKSLLNLGCYVSAFPQLIAGPIVRYSTVNEELENRKETWEDFGAGCKKFIVGLFKKVLLANNMALICDTLYAGDIASLGFIGTLTAAVCFTLQIYFDFSGYSDMAIGIGRMLGFHYLENFNYPYIARSITDFWRRWHISLSSFFRDYVYIPMGGNRVSKKRNILNLFVVWSLTGLWHGASWNFLLWGLYFFVILILEKSFWLSFLKNSKVISHVYTMILVIVGFMIFYFTDLNSLGIALSNLVGLNGLGNLDVFITHQLLTVKNVVIFIIAVLVVTPVFSKFTEKMPVLIILFLVSIISMVVSSYNPFIYFRF